MDWNPKIASAKKILDKYGAAMTVVKIVPGSYAATSDSYSSTLTSYSTIGVITNPVIQTSPGEYSRSDKLRLILSASGLPNLESVDYKVVQGTNVWFPNSTRAVKPGGTVIIYLVDLK